MLRGGKYMQTKSQAVVFCAGDRQPWAAGTISAGIQPPPPTQFRLTTSLATIINDQWST